jgi:hypothetical protein
VQNVQSSSFKVKVDEVIYGTGLQSGDEINVNYDSTEANVLLGTLNAGDKVIVYGKLGMRARRRLMQFFPLLVY